MDMFHNEEYKSALHRGDDKIDTLFPIGMEKFSH